MVRDYAAAGGDLRSRSTTDEEDADLERFRPVPGPGGKATAQLNRAQLNSRTAYAASQWVTM